MSKFNLGGRSLDINVGAASSVTGAPMQHVSQAHPPIPADALHPPPHEPHHMPIELIIFVSGLGAIVVWHCVRAQGFRFPATLRSEVGWSGSERSAWGFVTPGVTPARNRLWSAPTARNCLQIRLHLPRFVARAGNRISLLSRIFFLLPGLDSNQQPSG